MAESALSYCKRSPIIGRRTGSGEGGGGDGVGSGAEIRSTLEAVYEQLQRWAARSERPMWVWEEGRRLWHPLLEGA